MSIQKDAKYTETLDGNCPVDSYGIRCSFAVGHDGAHQALTVGWPPQIYAQWFDCPGGNAHCSGTMSTAERAVMGECGLCWGEKQPKCEHGCIIGGYCSACAFRDGGLAK